MYYDSKLIDLGSHQRFLLARHFSCYKVGGEVTRETAQARFLLGDLNAPTQFTDITHLCTLPRPASSLEAKRLTNQARLQQSLAESGDYSASHSKSLFDYARKSQHEAALALKPSVHVPRILMPAEDGRLMLGFIIESEKEFVAPELRLRLLDLHRGEIIADYPGSDHLGTVAAGRFCTLSPDARYLAVPQLIGNQLGALVLDCNKRFSPVGHIRAEESLWHIKSLQNAWLGLSDKRLWLFDEGLEPCFSIKLPRDILSWSAQCTASGDTIIMQTDRAGFCVLHPPATKLRQFNPHRGVRPSDRVQQQLSPCGKWVASQAGNELVLVSLENGSSWPIAQLTVSHAADTASEHDSPVCQLAPAFGFVGGVLVVASGESFELASFELNEPSTSGIRVAEQGRPGARKPLKIKRNSSLESMLDQADLASVAEPLQAFCSPAVRLRSRALKKAGWLAAGQPKAPALGDSRLGGWPDLPAGTPWPIWQDRPMAFLAQINLAAAHAAQPGLKLPAQGLLSFFLGCSEQLVDEDGPCIADAMLGSDPAHRGGWQVIYSSQLDQLQRQACELGPAPETFEPCSLSLHASPRQLPESDSPAIASLELPAELMENYQDLLAATAGSEEPEDQMMGHPQLLQYTPPEWQCSRAARGEDPWQLVEPSDSSYQSEMQKAAEWTLLLQLTSNEQAGFCWGDGGNLYFVGRRDELARGDFSNLWLSFEN